MMLGDCNCHPGTEFWREFDSFCQDNEYVVSDVEMLGIDSNSITYVSDMTDRGYWLDHAVASPGIHQLINCIDILNRYIISDHRPIRIIVNLSGILRCNNNDAPVESRKIQWSKMTNDSLNSYKRQVEINLDNIDIPQSVIYLDETEQTVIMNNITSYYGDIVNCLMSASDNLYTALSNNRPSRNIPGWNEFVREYHIMAKDAYYVWILNNCPRQGALHHAMCVTRSRFKYALRFCKQNEKNIIKNKLAASLSNKDSKSFWHEVRKQSNCRNSTSSNIEGVSGDQEIAGLWRNHFYSILSDVPREMSTNDIDFNDTNYVNVNFNEVRKAINRLKKGSASGPDGISAEHFLFGGPKLEIHIALLFSAMLKYAFIPPDFMNVHIVPLVKNKTGDLSKKTIIDQYLCQ